MATTRQTLNGPDWVDLGTTPCLVSASLPYGVEIYVDTTIPDATARGLLLHREGDLSADIGVTGQHLYARPHRAASATVTVIR